MSRTGRQERTVRSPEEPVVDRRPPWRLVEELPPRSREPIGEAIRLFIDGHPLANLDHDPAWLASKAQGYGGDVRQYVCVDERGTLLGYAPFHLHAASFSFAVGGATLYDLPIRRYSLVGEPLFADTMESVESGLVSLFARVRRDVRGRDVVFGLGIPADSPFGRFIGSTRAGRLFHVVTHGPAYQRRMLRLPRTADDYLAGLGPETRKDLRRGERGLLKAMGGEVRVEVYTRPEAVGEFLEAAATVSERTYQWKQFGIGVRNSEPARSHFERVARLGWFRGYVLYCRGVPAAFQLGYLYRSTYHAELPGYDPAFADFGVGNVLHLGIVRDLVAEPGRPEWFDFASGDSPHKRRLSTHARLERNCYLVPRSLRWMPIVCSVRGFNAAMAHANALLDRFGLRDRIKQGLRRRAQR